MFGLLWPSGAQLAARMAAHPVVLGARVLEIGCGLALASLVGHRRGNDMTASDCHPLTAGFLLENLRLNALPPMKYRRGHWGMAETGADGDVHGMFDLIIGSDLLYERDAKGLLAAFIGRHAGPAAEVWIVDPDRGNRPAFNRQMADEGFGMCEERLDQLASVSQRGIPGAIADLPANRRLRLYIRPFLIRNGLLCGDTCRTFNSLDQARPARRRQGHRSAVSPAGRRHARARASNAHRGIGR
jgi:hypothetical protein